MGQQQSIDQLLYKKAVDGNAEAVKSLRKNGASLEWIDPEGRSPLIVACSNPDLFIVAETLVKLGANLNAYREGSEGGTPLHHAARSCFHHTIKLLLSHGANPLIRNDDSQTPLDIARIKGSVDSVRAIESHICSFSGWLREFHHGPAFLEALPLHPLSRLMWVVIIPIAPHHPASAPQLELVIYPTLLDCKPRTVIALSEAEIEEPNVDQADPALIIFDNISKTRHRFTPSVSGDIQPLLRLYNACRGNRAHAQNRQVEGFHNRHDTSNSAAGTETETTAAVECQPVTSMNMSSHQSSTTTRSRRAPLFPNNDHKSDAYGWTSCTNCSCNNEPRPREVNKRGWRMDSRVKEVYNGWGAFEDGPAPPEPSSRGWTNQPVKEEECTSRWRTSQSRRSGCNYNGLANRFDAEQDDRELAAASRHNNSGNTISTRVPHVVQSGNGISALVSAAPHLPDDEVTDEGTIHHYPSVQNTSRVPVVPDSCSKLPPLHPSAGRASLHHQTTSSEANNGSSSSSNYLCAVCWQVSIEGACIPCGHMACCMACLNKVKSRKGACPVCRAVIDQIIRIYPV